MTRPIDFHFERTDVGNINDETCSLTTTPCRRKIRLRPNPLAAATEEKGTQMLTVLERKH